MEEEKNNQLAYTRPVISLLRKFTSFRPISYTSECAEAGRPILPKYLLNFGYAVSIGYIFSDILIKVYDIENEEIISNKKEEIVKYTVLDSLLWHTSASLVVPAVTIHTFVSGVSKIQNFISKKNFNLKIPSRIGFLVPMIPTIAGLASIPFIIHPIDNLTDIVMDKYVRPFYLDKLKKD